jgi:hypothetical protein
MPAKLFDRDSGYQAAFPLLLRSRWLPFAPYPRAPTEQNPPGRTIRAGFALREHGSNPGSRPRLQTKPMKWIGPTSKCRGHQVAQPQPGREQRQQEPRSLTAVPLGRRLCAR